MGRGVILNWSLDVKVNSSYHSHDSSLKYIECSSTFLISLPPLTFSTNMSTTSKYFELMLTNRSAECDIVELVVFSPSALGFRPSTHRIDVTLFTDRIYSFILLLFTSKFFHLHWRSDRHLTTWHRVRTRP